MKKHPIKEIQQAIEYAKSKNWRVSSAGGSSHAWARLKCPEASRQGCIISIWSTPRVAEHHAAQIKKAVDRCPHS